VEGRKETKSIYNKKSDYLISVIGTSKRRPINDDTKIAIKRHIGGAGYVFPKMAN